MVHNILEKFEGLIKERGSSEKVHNILEKFEGLIKERGSSENIDDLVPAAIDQVSGREPAEASDLEVGLRTMERRRTERIMAFYLAHREDYYVGTQVAH